MVWIVLVVVAALFLVGVAIHFSRIEKIQSSCIDSLENLRKHHDEMMRQIDAKYLQKNQALNDRIAELEIKLATEQRLRCDQGTNSIEECEKLNRERATLESHVAELEQENVLLSSIISNVRDAVGAE